MKLDTKYDTFVGQKVLVDVTPREYKGFSCDKYDLNKDDTTISAIKVEAEKVGLHLRVWLPRTMGTMDYRMDCLNVHVEEQEDGTFQVTRINLG